MELNQQQIPIFKFNPYQKNNFNGEIKRIKVPHLWAKLPNKRFLFLTKVEETFCPKLPSVVASSSPKAWREQPCLLLFLNLFLCRTPQRGSSRSKLGMQTLWRQPVPRQIGQGVLYVKLKAGRHRSAGHSLKKPPFVAAKQWRRSTIWAALHSRSKGEGGGTTNEGKTGPSLRVDSGLEGTERCLLSCERRHSRPTETVSLKPRVSSVVLQRQLPFDPVGSVDGTGRSRCLSLSAPPQNGATNELVIGEQTNSASAFLGNFPEYS